MKKFFTVALLLCTLFSKAQTFSWSGYSSIIPTHIDTVFIPVSGLPATLNTNFGISKVCFEVRHSDKSNLTILLVSPGGNSVILVEGQGSAGQDFIGTCVGMDGVPFQAGVPPFTGTFLPTGNLSNFNSGIDPNGTWMILTSDNNPDTGSIRFASITFSNDPPQGNGLGGNNLGPQGPFIRAGLVCPDAVSGCDLLPDMTASALDIQTTLQETTGMLRLSNSTPNIGYGPLEIFGIDSCFCNGVPSPCNQPCANGAELQHVIRQRVYRKIPGTDTLGFFDRDAGRMTYHPEHGHLHVDHWADFTLRKATADPDPRNWPIIGTSVKQSYCLINLRTCPGSPGYCVDNNGNNISTFPNYNFGFYSGCGMNQGIYPGNFDVYSAGLNEPIMLNGVCNGNYYIVSITDPNNIFLESDETNNVAVVPVTLTRQSPAMSITSNITGNVCTGDSIILTASQAPNYLWSTGDTSRSIVVKTNGTYTVSNDCGGTVTTSQPFVANFIPAGAKAEVSISITSGGNPSCSATPITFTATGINGGGTPIYQWKIDGVNVGTNSPVFTSTSLQNTQKVSCVFTSSVACLTNIKDTSNEITILITPPAGAPFLTATEIIKGTNPQCSGDTITFKAAAHNGSIMYYQWKVDGVNAGTNSDTFSSTTLTNGQTVTCEVSVLPICPSKYSFGNGTVQNITSSVQGAAYPTFYGNGRQQYLIKAEELTAMGISAGNISSLGFNIGAAIGNPDTLTGYTIKIASTNSTQMTTLFQTPSFVTVYGPVDYVPTINTTNTHYFNRPFYWNGASNIIIDICFATGQYGTASYQNNITYAPFTASAYFRQDNADGLDACSRTVASATTTARPNMLFGMNEVTKLTSAPIVMSVNSAEAPSVTVSIFDGYNPQCAGATTKFIAIPDNTGEGPSYQWMKNNVDINGATQNIFTTTGLIQNDSISCRMTTGSVCEVSQNVLSNKFGIDIALPVYRFTGSGNWDNPSNWLNGKMPPAKLLSCSEIVVAPAGTAESILNVPQVIAPGAKLTIAAGKKFRVIGKMLVQE